MGAVTECVDRRRVVDIAVQRVVHSADAAGQTVVTERCLFTASPWTDRPA